MPSRVGRITAINDDGTVRAVNELTKEEWFGRIVIGSGGTLMFDVVDERGLNMSDKAGGFLPESVRTGRVGPEGGEHVQNMYDYVPPPAPQSAIEHPTGPTRVAVGKKK